MGRIPLIENQKLSIVEVLKIELTNAKIAMSIFEDMDRKIIRRISRNFRRASFPICSMSEI